MTPLHLNHPSFSTSYKTCFDDFSAVVYAGQRIGIIGQNGSGKSTLLRLIRDTVTTHRVDYVPQIVENHQTLSGGQRFQRALSEALANQPDVLILDEPTNHLDQGSRASLMAMLQRFPGVLLIASHDVALLRQCVDSLWHLQDGQVHIFNGTYDAYQREIHNRQASLESQLHSLRREQKSTHQALMQEQSRAKHSRQTGEKHIKERKYPTITSSAKARRAEETSGNKRQDIRQARDRVVSQLQNIRLPEVIRPTFALTSQVTHAGDVVAIKAGSCGYTTPVLEDFYLTLPAQGRLAIYGDNGSGKSTLVKAILGHSDVWRKGDWHVPKHDDIGYLDQHYASLDPKATVLETLSHTMPTWSHSERRRHLNDFLFRKNEEVNCAIHHLSGGEKARLSLALIAAKPPKLLILDEVTNNLDLESRDHVIQVLRSYPGAIIVISHDTDFLGQLGITMEVRVTAG